MNGMVDWKKGGSVEQFENGWVNRQADLMQASLS